MDSKLTKKLDYLKDHGFYPGFNDSLECIWKDVYGGQIKFDILDTDLSLCTFIPFGGIELTSKDIQSLNEDMQELEKKMSEIDAEDDE